MYVRGKVFNERCLTAVLLWAEWLLRWQTTVESYRIESKENSIVRLPQSSVGSLPSAPSHSGSLENRDRAVIIKLFKKFILAVAIRLKSVGNVVRRQRSHHVPPVTPSVHLANDSQGIPPRGVHTRHACGQRQITLFTPSISNVYLEIVFEKLTYFSNS